MLKKLLLTICLAAGNYHASAMDGVEFTAEQIAMFEECKALCDVQNKTFNGATKRLWKDDSGRVCLSDLPRYDGFLEADKEKIQKLSNLMQDIQSRYQAQHSDDFWQHYCEHDKREREKEYAKQCKLREEESKRARDLEEQRLLDLRLAHNEDMIDAGIDFSETQIQFFEEFNRLEQENSQVNDRVRKKTGNKPINFEDWPVEEKSEFHSIQKKLTELGKQYSDLYGTSDIRFERSMYRRSIKKEERTTARKKLLELSSPIKFSYKDVPIKVRVIKHPAVIPANAAQVLEFLAGQCEYSCAGEMADGFDPDAFRQKIQEIMLEGIAGSEDFGKFVTMILDITAQKQQKFQFMLDTWTHMDWENFQMGLNFDEMKIKLSTINKDENRSIRQFQIIFHEFGHEISNHIHKAEDIFSLEDIINMIKSGENPLLNDLLQYDSETYNEAMKLFQSSSKEDLHAAIHGYYHEGLFEVPEIRSKEDVQAFLFPVAWDEYSQIELLQIAQIAVRGDILFVQRYGDIALADKIGSTVRWTHIGADKDYMEKKQKEAPDNSELREKIIQLAARQTPKPEAIEALRQLIHSIE